MQSIEETALRLIRYCSDRDWAGYEPFDALNSRIFRAIPLLNCKWPRIALVQSMRRSPIDIRGLLGVPPSRNAKGMGLFLSALINMRRAGVELEGNPVGEMIDALIELRSPGSEYWCWGYNFPWQGRTFLVPAGDPNLVCTAFVANGLLDAFEFLHDERLFEMARSAAGYMLDALYWTSGDKCGFAYPEPHSRLQVHNANLLASALLARIHKYAAKEQCRETALRVARYTVDRQRPDGSWLYGEATTASWVDNFHTGYNLGALLSLGRTLNSEEFAPAVSRGFRFYRDHFFLSDGAVRYYHNRTFPIESHCVAQSIITLLDCQHLDHSSVVLSQKVLDWAMKNMWDQKDGYFYYRVLRAGKIRTSYMRWTQAWMLLALSRIILNMSTSSVDESRACTAGGVFC